MYRLQPSPPGRNQVLSVLSDLAWALRTWNGDECNESTPIGFGCPELHRRRVVCPVSLLLVRIDVFFLRTVSQLPTPLSATRNPTVMLPVPVCGHTYPNQRPLQNT